MREAVSLDKLEQLDQSPDKAAQTGQNPTQPKLTKRARAKYLSRAVAGGLLEQGGSLRRAYALTLSCTARITQDAETGALKTFYCGNRWCLVCNRIRTAKAINAYRHILDEWMAGDGAYFVTLTVQNCRGHEIRSTYEQMLEALTSCKRSIKRTHGLNFEALRKFETTHNREKDTYHPHFHLVVRGEIEAEALRSLWLDRAPTNVSWKAQDVRPLDAEGTMEMFKYFTKLIGKDRTIDPPALRVIFEQIKGLRTFQPIGFRASDYTHEGTMEIQESDPDGDLQTRASCTAYKRHGENVVWQWVQDYADWVDWETGECLTGYEPTDKYRSLVESVNQTKTNTEKHEAVTD